jgi:hypothetical protein
MAARSDGNFFAFSAVADLIILTKNTQIAVVKR